LNMYSLSTFCSLRNKFSEWLRRAGDKYRYHLKLGRHNFPMNVDICAKILQKVNKCLFNTF